MRYPSPTRRLPLAAALVVALASVGCAYSIPEVDPADIPRLETAVASNPDDTGLQVQLGMAQFKAENYSGARATLTAAVDAGNETGAALLYLGMTHEEFEDWTAARDAYNRYLDAGRSEPLKEEIRKRLQLIARNVLQAQAQEALAQESQLAGAQVTPRSVAILPFGFNSDREDLEPLIYALSDMMITDFAVSNALTVLERAQIQTLLDEMSLTEAGYADASTGARAGRLLQAEHVLQGVITTLGEAQLRLDTDVLNIPRSESAGTVDAEDELANLFDMEKDLVFRTLRDVLGVELTPAEEQAILENRSDNVLAFLAYGRGLREQDRGNYAGALAQFQQAQQLDPDFDAASAAAGDAQNLQDASTTTTGGIAQVAAATGETSSGAVSAATGTTTASTGAAAGALGNAAEGVDPTPTTGTLDLGATTGTGDPAKTGDPRDPVQESQGQEGVTKTATAQIRIVIRRPGGE
ncbi:MAG: CsgG/HfaB family protein [Longimicrobiales bacterium]